MGYEVENTKLEQYKDFPYCVVGHSSIPSSFGITLKGKGIKKIVEKMNDEDLLHITFFGDTKATEFEISKYIDDAYHAVRETGGKDNG